MTNPTRLLSLALIAAGCSTATALPERIYDFAERDVTGEVGALTTASSPKAQLRGALEQLQPALARCTRGTSGTIELTLRIAVESDAPAVLESAQLAYRDAGAADCLRLAVAGIDLSHMNAHDSAIWVVHAPFVVARS